MKNKLRKYIIESLKRLLAYFTAPSIAEQYRERYQKVNLFFHEILPHMDDKWAGKVIIEGGKFNYFVLQSGELPKFDFVLPEIPLYVIVADIRSANWEQAKEAGVERNTWEEYQYDLSQIKATIPNLATIGTAVPPRLVIIEWNDPLNHYYLVQRIEDGPNEL